MAPREKTSQTMGVMRIPVTQVLVGDIIEWGPVKDPVLDSFHSHSSLNSMRTLGVRQILQFPDRQGRAFIVFYTHQKQLLKITHQAVLNSRGEIVIARTAPSHIIRESPPAFYLDTSATVGVHRRPVTAPDSED